jgi:hypothetical protein
MPFGADSCVNDIVSAAKNESPDVSQNETLGEVMPLIANEGTKRRRWESNPRWRICNPLP